MLETLKNIMTPDPLQQAKRDAERDLQRARSELEARAADLERATSASDTLKATLAAAQENFDADPSDDNADRLIECRRNLERGDLFLAREKRREAQARQLVRDAEAEIARAERAILEDLVSTERVHERLAPHVAKVAKAVQLLTEAQEGAEAIARDVAEAEHQLGVPNRLGRSTAWLTSGLAQALRRAGDNHFAKIRSASHWLEEVRPR